MDYTVISPATVTISERAKIGRGAVIYPNNVILGDSTVGVGAVRIRERHHGQHRGREQRTDGERARRGKDGRFLQGGTFAHLRPGARIGEGCRIGNFVEIKTRASARVQRSRT